jgi:type I restriction enzyme, S subunit
VSHALKPYPANKDAGVPWLGKVPTHWRMERAKWLFERMQRPVRPIDKTVTCFRDGMVTLRENRRTSGFTESLKEIGYQGVRRGDLVIHAMDAFAGAVGVSDSDGKCTPVYAVCQPKLALDTHYYAYIVREMARTQYIVALSRGVRQRSTDFRFDNFANQVLPVPPSSEQKAIAAFLLHVDRLTRRYLRAQHRLIVLLEEQKQALIQRAVTRGLNPDVPLKDSGVEWLEEILVHWKVVRLKHLLSENLINGLFKKKEYFGSGTPLINVSDIYQDNLCVQTEQLELVEASNDEIRTFRVMPGDIFFVRSSLKLEGTARSAYVEHCDENTVFECHLVRGRPDSSRVKPLFLIYYLNTPQAHNQLVSRVNTVTMSTLPQGAISSLEIILPPMDEQCAIIKSIKSVSKSLDIAINHIQRQIDLIREYRTRLIADVVTGKLDVRGVPLPEPDADDAPDDFDDLEEETPFEDLDTEELNDADD